MEEHLRENLDTVLLGKTGHGKSATGNSILGWGAFKAASYHESVTKQVQSERAERGDFLIKVVDTPGLFDTELTLSQDKERTVKNMTEVFSHCGEGVHVFGLVVRFDVRMTLEEREVFVTLRSLFGENCFKDHGIVVVTHGDKFKDMMEENGQHMTFEEWIRQSDLGPLGDLIKECGNRCVLFDNKTKDENIKATQFKKFLGFAEELRKNGIYTNDTFKSVAKNREKLISDLKLPYLKEELQKQIGLLRQKLNHLLTTSDVEEADTVIEAADALVGEIDNEGTSLLADLRENVEDIRKKCQDFKTNIEQNNQKEASLKLKLLEEDAELLKERQNPPPSFWKLLFDVVKYVLLDVFETAVTTAGKEIALAIRRGISLIGISKKK